MTMYAHPSTGKRKPVLDEVFKNEPGVYRDYLKK